MIKVNIRNNVERRSVLVDETTTIRQFMLDNDMAFSPARFTLDGVTITESNMDKNFDQFGATDGCTFSQTVKSDNN